MQDHRADVPSDTRPAPAADKRSVAATTRIAMQQQRVSEAAVRQWLHRLAASQSSSTRPGSRA